MVIRVKDEQGQLITFGRFEEAHLLRLTDLLPDNQAYELLRLREEPGNLARLHGCASKARLYRQLILRFLAITLDELILNLSTYKLPTSGSARWKVQAKSRAEVAYLARINTYQFVDLYKTNGRIYELVMSYYARGRRHRRVLRVDYARYKRLCRLIERPPAAPRQPRQLTTRELALRLAASYPLLEAESVVATCTSFMRLLYSVIRSGREVRISSGGKKGALNLKIYKPCFDVMRVALRARRGQNQRRRERWIRRRRVFFQRELKLPKLGDLFELRTP